MDAYEPAGQVAGVRVEPFVELSQMGYVLVVDYGLANALPQPQPMLVKPSRRAKGDGGEPVR